MYLIFFLFFFYFNPRKKKRKKHKTKQNKKKESKTLSILITEFYFPTFPFLSFSFFFCLSPFWNIRILQRNNLTLLFLCLLFAFQVFLVGIFSSFTQNTNSTVQFSTYIYTPILILTMAGVGSNLEMAGHHLAWQ